MPLKDALSFRRVPVRAKRVRPPVLGEHSLARLTAPLPLEDGRILPAGATGAIVGVWRDGAAYEVEFEEPFMAVLTVAAAGLKQA